MKVARSSVLRENDKIFDFLGSSVEKKRYRTILKSLGEWSRLFSGKKVLDFGASWGTSTIALLHHHAQEVVGVEPSESRVVRGVQLFEELGVANRASLIHVSDTSHLPFRDDEFEFILANAVFEHIPQPRERFVRELWRVLAPDGCLMVSETPNKYFPKELHTTQLWFNHWLPKDVAHWRAVRAGRFERHRDDWMSSGWRGVGYFEITRCLGNFELLPETEHSRHRILAAVGVPASIIDPYPVWVFQKR